MLKRVLGIVSTLSVGVTTAPAAFAQVSMEAGGEATAQLGDSSASAEVAQAETTSPEPAALPAPAQPAAEAPAPAEPAAEEEAASIPGWFRMDSDGLGLQLWFGATHSLGGIDLATDIYVSTGSALVPGDFAEFDIGPVLTLAEGVTITPMAGIGFNWSSQSVTTLIAPQFFTIANLDSIYIEQWTQGFFNSIFTDGAPDNLYLRNQVFLKVSEDVAIGPQVELTLALNDTESTDEATGMTVTNERETLASLAPGLGTNIAYGANNTLGLWLGMETAEASQVGGDDIVGRFTFVRTW